MDAIEDGAARLALYRLEGKDQIVQELVAILEQASLGVETVIKALRPKGGFWKKKELGKEELAAVFTRVHHLENQADQILREALSDLFDQGKDALVVMKRKEIYETLEEAIDWCKHVTNVVEGILIENS